MRNIALLLIMSGLLFVGCADVRQVDGEANCVSYPAVIQPLLTDACESCHGATLAEGDYRVDSYRSVMAADSTGTPRVVAGDANSVLLTRAGGENHDTADMEVLDTLEKWVVGCELSYFANALVHARGWLRPGDDEFHGEVLKSSDWNFAQCVECHGSGSGTRGGPSGKSCTACHENGPTACNTCHGDELSPAPPRGLHGGVSTSDEGVGAHRTHVLGGPGLGRKLSCNECHIVPSSWRDVGHIFLEDGTVDTDGRAEVTLGDLANADVAGRVSPRTGPAQYDSTSGTCSNVYCHGGASAAPKSPVWNDPTSDQSPCVLCHAVPPASSHAPGYNTTDCVTCHAASVNSDLTLVDASLHLDRRISLGDGSRTCQACHGSSLNAAPPNGMGGETTTDTLAVGAHQAHVVAGTFTGPIDCSACHDTPEQTGSFLGAVTTQGHVDSRLPAELFPGGAAFGGLGAFDSATPAFDRGTATCSGVYCHGGSQLALADNPIGVPIKRSPVWIGADNGTIICGSCHGIPMTVAGHLASYTRTDCVLCHASVIDSAGAIIFDSAGDSLHINGSADFNQ